MSLFKFLFTSSNVTLFYINYIAWLSSITGVAYYYHNIYVSYILCGILCWSFWEYIYHRFAMHGLKNTIYYYKMHGHHHTYPERRSHVPIFQYVIVCPLFYVLFFCFFQTHSAILSYSIGHFIGLFCFEKMHCYIHNDTQKIQIYTKYHMHHHQNSNQSYCFTSPFFDILCGTFPDDIFSYNIIALLPIPCIGFYGVQYKTKSIQQ